MIRQLIQMLLVLLFGMNNGPKHDLRKKPTMEDNKRRVKTYLKNYFMRYGWIFITLLIILGLILFAFICFKFVGASVESGNYYYHLKGVV